MASFSLSTMGRGVWAGAAYPHQPIQGGGGGGNTGGASGSWGPPAGGASGSWGASAAAAAANKDDDLRKKVLERTESYKSQAAEVRRLTSDLGELRKMLGELQRTGQGGSPLAKELEDRIGGISEKLDSLRQKAERSVRDDAGQRMLQNIREQNAALEAQLLERDKLGAAARAQAAFEQQLADLRGKANLTVDQKAILAKADQIRLELEWGVALERARAIQEDLAKAEKERLKNLERFQERRYQLQSSMGSASDLRGEQYDRRLAAFTMGDQAFQRTQETESIYREYRRYQEQLNKATPKDLLGSSEYKRASAEISAQLRAAIAANENYYFRLGELQSDWSVGANRAFANFLTDAANVAKQSERAFSGLFDGLTSSVAKWATGAKVSFGDVARQFAAMLVEMQIRAAASSLLKAAGGSGGLGGLFGQALGFLGLGGGSGAATVGGSGLIMPAWPGSSSGVGLHFAQGAAFDRGNVIPFAKGGAFSNKIVSSPTRFDIGEMGEAGPEAIMPLTKTARGVLGVRAVWDAPAGAAAPNLRVVVNNTGMPKDFEVQQITREEVVLIARDQVDRHAPRVMASQAQDLDSDFGRSLRGSYKVEPSR
ncbi:phage tail tape measure protein [Alcaligenaceae bacterium SAGV5]|nr:phage tail tape measure protein [Alcaligenaceae bacterium SAGV5]